MEITNRKRLKLLAGRSHPALAQAVAGELGVPLERLKLIDFANGEIGCRIEESVRGTDVFVLQTHVRPMNRTIMEQLIMLDAVERASAKRITAICPFLGYARQDHKALSREPISARLLVDLLTTAGADRILSIDLHSSQIQGFSSRPFDHLTAVPVLRAYIKEYFGEGLTIVAPDTGRVRMAERYAGEFNAELAIVHKRRDVTQAHKVEVLDVVGSVKGKTCVLVDDMIDTAGTIVAAVAELKEQGAETIYAAATHGVFSGPAFERLEKSPIEKVIVTDTLPLDEKNAPPNIEVVSIAPKIAETIRAIFEDRSVSELFGGENQM